jgi:hypothetical protein
MNNNFDELILKRRARGRARTASMGAHVLWGTKGGRERLGGADGGRECGGMNGRGTRGARGAVGRMGRGVRTAEGAHGRGAPTCAPPVGGAYGARMPAGHVARGGTYVHALQWGHAHLK